MIVEENSLLVYAASFWCRHFLSSETEERREPTHSLVLKIFQPESCVSHYNWLRVVDQELIRSVVALSDHLNQRHLEPLYCSSLLGLVHVTQRLIESGADVNTKTEGEHVYSLQAAASRGHENVVRLLVENGANVNAVHSV